MPRIVGVEVPGEKRIETALTYIYGIGRTLSKRIMAKANIKPETLKITSINVTPGKRYKRFRPAARGSALPFQLKTSHITVSVDGEKRQPKKPTPSSKKEQK